MTDWREHYDHNFDHDEEQAQQRTCGDCGTAWFPDEEDGCPRCRALPTVPMSVVGELRSRIKLLDPDDVTADGDGW